MCLGGSHAGVQILDSSDHVRQLPIQIGQAGYDPCGNISGESTAVPKLDELRTHGLKSDEGVGHRVREIL